MLMNIREIEGIELAQRLESSQGKLKIIDVREHAEIATGTVPGADAVPMNSIPSHMESLNRDDELVIVCRSGQRSAQVCLFLQQQGFKNVFNLRGGIMQWATNALPIALPEAV